MNIISIIIAIILFSIIVIFHELGHFWLAKANGIKVNEFCLGLGPTLFGVQRGETKYSIKLLPFGGACIMEGEDESSGDDRAFNNKSVWARISVVFAGPFFNFIRNKRQVGLPKTALDVEACRKLWFQTEQLVAGLVGSKLKKGEN